MPEYLTTTMLVGAWTVAQGRLGVFVELMVGWSRAKRESKQGTWEGAMGHCPSDNSRAVPVATYMQVVSDKNGFQNPMLQSNPTTQWTLHHLIVTL
jgi:hypothetical protein